MIHGGAVAYDNDRGRIMADKFWRSADGPSMRTPGTAPHQAGAREVLQRASRAGCVL